MLFQSFNNVLLSNLFVCASMDILITTILFLMHRVRFHYGHPDVFDRLFHITRGGISKASKTINLSEDVFAGNLY